MQVRAHLAHDSRLIVPVGACDQYGPHLPLGAATVVAERVAAELSREFRVLRAPALAYGVNVDTERPYPGAASLREKTLHRALNDLLASWEDDGITEFLLLTAHSSDAHVEAIATVSGTGARVRVLDLLDIDFSAFLRGERQPQHAGEVMTSLMLYLCPDKVNLDEAQDFPPARLRQRRTGRVDRIPADSLGAVGYPSYATAETGERIFRDIVRRIRERVFIQGGNDAAR